MKLGKNPAARLLAILLVPVSAFLFIGWADSWEGLARQVGTIKTARAAFIQEKHLEILSKPLISKGLFYFKAPNSLRWEYEYPVKSILLMHNGKVTRFVKSDEGFTRDEGMKLQAMQVVMEEISFWLSGKFRENPNFEAVLEPGPTIILTPKEKALARIIEKIALLLSETPGLIETVTIYENENSFTKLVFKDARLNDPMEDFLFEKIE